MRLLLFLFFLSLGSIAQAQIIERFQLEFETAKYHLTNDQRKAIDEVVNGLANIPQAYDVQVVGHTDNVGDLSYNQRLSEQRARAVSKYMERFGFASKHIEDSGEAFNQPLATNDSEEGKARNRRVEVIISIHQVQLPQMSNVSTTKSYEVEVEAGAILEYPSGTKLAIPANAFVDANGNPVTGTVEVQYAEFSSPVDFMFSGASMVTHQDGEMAYYNSAGMFEITANKDGQELLLGEGKQIEVGLAMRDSMENVNFYEYNKATREWTTLGKLTDEQGNPIATQGMATAGRVATDAFDGFAISVEDPQYYCNNQGCWGVVNALKDGINFAQSKKSLQELQADYQRYSEKRNKATYKHYELAAQQSTVSSKLRKVQHSYKLRIRSGGKRKQTLVLRCKAKVNNELDEMNGVVWHYDFIENEKLNRRWAKAIYHTCEIQSQGDGQYTLSMACPDTSFSIPVTPVLKGRSIGNFRVVQKVKRKKARYDAVYAAYQADVDSLSQRLKSIEAEDAKVQAEVNRLNAILLGLPNQNRLVCLAEFSKGISTNPTEKAFSYEGWLNYFDNNKSQLLARYQSYEQTAEYQACKAEVDSVQAQIAARQEAQRLASEKRNKINQLAGQTLMISNLGMFNADQVKRLPSPVQILAKYEDQNGTKVEPIGIFMCFKSINGVIEYNGFLGYSPYKFKVPRYDKMAMFAIDLDGNMYRVPKSYFASLSLRNNMRHTFKLEKVEEGTPKEELQATL